MTTINCAKCGLVLTPEQAGEPCPQCGGLDRNLTAQERAVLAEKVRVARDLAQQHFRIEPGVTQISTIWTTPAYEARPDTPIKLLEVNSTTVPSGIMPLHFGPVPARGIPYSSVIIEVTPDEFERIKIHDLKLPDDWVLGEVIPRPPDTDGSA